MPRRTSTVARARPTTYVTKCELRESSVFGVLEMTLGRGSYRWQFVPEAHRHFSDQGQERCH